MPQGARTLAFFGTLGAIAYVIWDIFVNPGQPLPVLTGDGAPSGATKGTAIGTPGGTVTVATTAPAQPAAVLQTAGGGPAYQAAVALSAAAAASSQASINKTASPTQATLNTIAAVQASYTAIQVTLDKGNVATVTPTTITPAVAPLYGEDQRDLLTFGDGSQASVLYFANGYSILCAGKKNCSAESQIPNATAIVLNHTINQQILIQTHAAVNTNATIFFSQLSDQKG